MRNPEYTCTRECRISFGSYRSMVQHLAECPNVLAGVRAQAQRALAKGVHEPAMTALVPAKAVYPDLFHPYETSTCAKRVRDPRSSVATY